MLIIINYKLEVYKVEKNYLETTPKENIISLEIFK
ncbi:hypothetical protein FPSE_11117 [Fusarium pseudograminearum CS3096]|uniref:Uncharacterized protein n=1 Tax=Fusarium pseudograminearum (strain CS3096) TaxID=1028729 RepID=K3VXD4_FUSPC|nr:hypothetical protein FPSE_11117 [Fusarium pseudograminearum CS3096]EKJ68705.1 hypothetical protein FPSE_11117 [Fusarium pseudograminearum CS3096]